MIGGARKWKSLCHFFLSSECVSTYNWYVQLQLHHSPSLDSFLSQCLQLVQSDSDVTTWHAWHGRVESDTELTPLPGYPTLTINLPQPHAYITVLSFHSSVNYQWSSRFSWYMKQGKLMTESGSKFIHVCRGAAIFTLPLYGVVYNADTVLSPARRFLCH